MLRPWQLLSLWTTVLWSNQLGRPKAGVPVPSQLTTRTAPADGFFMKLEHARQQMIGWSRRVRKVHICLIGSECRPIGYAFRARSAGARETGPIADHRVGISCLLRRWWNFRPKRRRTAERTEDVGQLAGVKAVQTGSVSRRIAVIEEIKKSGLADRRLFSPVAPQSTRRKRRVWSPKCSPACWRSG